MATADDQRVVQTEAGVGSALQQVTERDGYTPGGARTSLTDANGNTSAFEYDGFGRLKRLRYPATPMSGAASRRPRPTSPTTS